MAWGQKTMIDVVRKQAATAASEGRAIFTPELNAPAMNGSGGGIMLAVDGWGEAVEAIEAEGWRLEHWTVDSDKGVRPRAYPLFRRA